MGDRVGAARPGIPFSDLRPANAPLQAELTAAVGEVLASGHFVAGPAVLAFEEAFAEWAGSAFCVGVASGTDALRLALLALELEAGDEVVVPAATFVATFEAVVQAGGRPVPADVSALDGCLDPAAAAAAVTARTRALLPVHLYGQLADMHGLGALAAARGVALVEDAAQAHGASRDGVAAGRSGAATAYSFYPSKNLGAAGDAGALTTDDERLARRVRSLREHGRDGEGHTRIGYTSRLDSVQAAVLLIKLPHVAEWNRLRAAAATAYGEQLEGVGDLVLPAPQGEHAWHLYVVRTAKPDELRAHLAERGVDARRHYARPPHLEPAFASLGHGEGAFPEAESLFREVLSLPLFPGLAESQIAAVTTAVRDYFDRTSRSSSAT